ncbi:MerR family transcriptional regulator [Kocuria sp. ZOR0020]|uniref:MerR family transcriptional regulator n=1 Tax=Kocuria sp. ZOR0020 TaxID=1339234 RepID=UPI000645959F|nr:MerR family transcriptional regulator [Kocuria sp. ZOR0020]
MKISALSAQTGVPVATLKFYLRKGLLQPGRQLSRTQADYDHTHVDRVRLVRALTEVGELKLDAVQRVLETLENPQIERLGLLGSAQRALENADVATMAPGHEPPAAESTDGPDSQEPSRARRWLSEREWTINPQDPLIDQLDEAWDACDQADLGVDASRLNVYADAAEKIARVDINSLPADPARAVHQVILGTLLVDPVLKILRRLAQQHLSITARQPPTD